MLSSVASDECCLRALRPRAEAIGWETDTMDCQLLVASVMPCEDRTHCCHLITHLCPLTSESPWMVICFPLRLACGTLGKFEYKT